MIISAPATDPDVTVALGVNFDDAYDADQHHVISNASCTTNCLAPVAKVLHETFGIEHGLMTTIHAYTADQRLQDMPHKDLRRARAAADQPDPRLDRRRQGGRAGAARAQGQAARLRGPRSRAHRARSSTSPPWSRARRRWRRSTRRSRRRRTPARFEGILHYTDDPIVSSDIVKSPHSSIFDAPLTSVLDGTLVKVVSWYDNEWGYSNRCVELAQRVLVHAHA